MNFLYPIAIKGGIWMALITGMDLPETPEDTEAGQAVSRIMSEVPVSQSWRTSGEKFGSSTPPLSLSVGEIQMIELLVVACRQDNCREVSLLYDPYELSLMTCIIVGQQEAARWQSSNPGWKIRRWSCGFVSSTEKTV